MHTEIPWTMCSLCLLALLVQIGPSLSSCSSRWACRRPLLMTVRFSRGKPGSHCHAVGKLVPQLYFQSSKYGSATHLDWSQEQQEQASHVAGFKCAFRALKPGLMLMLCPARVQAAMHSAHHLHLPSVPAIGSHACRNPNNQVWADTVNRIVKCNYDHNPINVAHVHKNWRDLWASLRLGGKCLTACHSVAL